MRPFLRAFIKIISAEETFTRSVAYDDNVNIGNASTPAIIITTEGGGGEVSIKCDLRYYNL